MCDPVSIIAGVSAAASLGGGLAQTARARSDVNRANKARSEQAQQELARQKDFRQNSQQVLADTRENVSRETYSESVADAIAKRMETAQSTATAPENSAVALRAGAPKIVRDTVASAQQGARDDSAQRTASLASLFGASDALTGQNLAQARSGSDIGLISTLARRSAALNPYEQNIAAQNAQKGPSSLADLVSGAGNIGLMLALSGNNPFGGSNAPKTAPTPRLKPRGT